MSGQRIGVVDCYLHLIGWPAIVIHSFVYQPLAPDRLIRSQIPVLTEVSGRRPASACTCMSPPRKQ
jgi:hypothetical protein